MQSCHGLYMSIRIPSEFGNDSATLRRAMDLNNTSVLRQSALFYSKDAVMDSKMYEVSIEQLQPVPQLLYEAGATRWSTPREISRMVWELASRLSDVYNKQMLQDSSPRALALVFAASFLVSGG